MQLHALRIIFAIFLWVNICKAAHAAPNPLKEHDSLSASNECQQGETSPSCPSPLYDGTLLEGTSNTPEADGEAHLAKREPDGKIKLHFENFRQHLRNTRITVDKLVGRKPPPALTVTAQTAKSTTQPAPAAVAAAGAAPPAGNGLGKGSSSSGLLGFGSSSDQNKFLSILRKWKYLLEE